MLKTCTSARGCGKWRVVRSPFSSVIYNVGLCRTAECCLCVGTWQALLQGWLLCVGFVCLANVLQCAVAMRDFELNVLSLENERNFVLGLRTTVRYWRSGWAIGAVSADESTKAG